MLLGDEEAFRLGHIVTPWRRSAMAMPFEARAEMNAGIFSLVSKCRLSRRVVETPNCHPSLGQ
jgi:hypothetical protein